MRTIKIKTNRYSRYNSKRIQKGNLTTDYSGSGQNVRGFIKYDPAAIADNSPDQSSLPIRTGYRTKSIKEGI